MTAEITAGDIAVRIPNAAKVLFPADGISKEDLARYYAAAAGRMLPWLRDRPVTMMRYPDGLAGQRIVQKCPRLLPGLDPPGPPRRWWPSTQSAPAPAPRLPRR